MTEITIYHNPRCSKSRQTLALLEQSSVSPEIVLYLDTPPTPAELEVLLRKLRLTARDLLRKGEDEYKTLGLADASLDEDGLLKAMSEYPKLIERPIVVVGDRAVLGRPPENVFELIAR